MPTNPADATSVNANYTGSYPGGTGQQSDDYRVVSNFHLQFEDSDAVATFDDATNQAGDGVTALSVIQTWKPNANTPKGNGLSAGTQFSPEIAGAFFHAVEDASATAAYTADDGGAALYGSVHYAWKYGDSKTSTMRGIHAGAQNQPSSSGDVATSIAGVFTNTNQGTGTMAVQRSIWCTRGSTAGAVTTSTGIYIGAFSGGTNPTNNYQLYVEDSSAKGSVISRGIFVAGASQVSEFVGRVVFGAPNSAIADAGLAVSEGSFYLNEAGNTLTVKVKYAAGTVKTGTIALV